MKKTLFQTDIYQFSLPIFPDPVIRDIKEWKGKDPAGFPRSNRGRSWHSQIDAYNRPAFTPVVQSVLQAATLAFASERYSRSSARITEMWANYLEPGGWHAPHNHGASLWSGVLHLTEGTRLCLVDPRPVMIQPRMYRSEMPEIIEPHVGQLLIFPGWLQHYVEPSDTERFSVSFNIAQIVKDGQVQKPPEDGKPVCVNIPKVLDEEDVQGIYHNLADKKWGRGLVDGGQTAEGRTNDVVFVDHTKPEWKDVYAKIFAAAQKVNDKHYKLDISGKATLQFARYGQGTRYGEHRDRGGEGDTAKRTLSCSVSLSKAAKGGGVRFPRQEKDPPHQEPGDAVFFAATEPHEALKVEEGTRDSLIIWWTEK